jgi:hypothetical protein
MSPLASSVIGVIQPPTGLRPVHHAEMIFDVAEGVILTGVAAYAIRRRAWVFLVLLLGTAIAGFVEPLDDNSSRLWFSSHVERPFTVFNHRTWTVFIPIGYALYYGLGSLAVYTVMRRRSRDLLLKFALFGMLFDAAVEIPWLHTRMYIYYGPQPFKIFGFPLYWAFINTAYLYLNAYAMYALGDWLRGRRIVVMAMIPVVGIGLLYGLAWPTWIIMNTSAPPAGQWAVATVTMALSVAFIWLVSTAVARYGSPLRLLAAAHPGDGSPAAQPNGASAAEPHVPATTRS